MAKFMFLYRDDPQTMAALSPEEMQEMLQMWMAWIESSMQAGWMVNAGDALHPAGAVVKADLSVMDGPFTESKELVGGYSVIEAEDLAAAIEYAKTWPGPKHGGSVEVRELADIGPEMA